MTAFTLKTIALVAMLVDHAQVVFDDVLPLWMRVVGRLTFPIFVFLLAEGFRHTRSGGRFLGRLAVFAVVSQPFFGWALLGAPAPWQMGHMYGTNIFVTLLLGGAAIVTYQHTRPFWRKRSKDDASAIIMAGLPVLFFAYLGALLYVDFGPMGVLFVFAVYLAGDLWPHTQTPRLWVMAGCCVLLHTRLYSLVLSGYGPYIGWEFYAMVPATLLAVVLVAAYNGQRGPGGSFMKWAFYVAYPGHLAVLGLLRWMW